MEALSNYWKLCQISLTRKSSAYEYRSLLLAQEFLQSQFSDIPNGQNKIQTILLSYFHAQPPTIAPVARAQAGLCLRCYVSEPILKACQKIASLFAGGQSFTYQDLLPFVLNDDGNALVILNGDGNTQLKLNAAGDTQPATYKLFAVEVLRTYKANSTSSMSLANWAFLQTRQHPELKSFLSEFGFQHLSDWALLNRVRSGQMAQLSDRDRHLVAVFHAVYRRDRRQQQHVSRCLNPTDRQLEEMNGLLQPQGLAIKAPSELLKALKQVAKQLRQFDIWQSREPLEVQNPETGSYDLRVDLPSDSFNALDVEEQDFLEFLHQQLAIVLAHSIEQAIQTQIAQLEKSKRYAPFAACLIPGLRLYYCEGLSLREIGPQLKMSSWDQTRRILNPGELLSKARMLTVQRLLEPILAQAQTQGVVSMPPEPDELRTLTEQIESFVDAKIFAEAVSEIKAGKNRLMDSVYAQQLKHYIERTV